MKNKKILLIIYVFIAMILLLVTYCYIISHTFPTQNNAKALMVKKIKEIENETDRAEMINLLIQENFLTEKEARELK